MKNTPKKSTQQKLHKFRKKKSKIVLKNNT